MSKRILFLFSDTGGGHRAATNAIIEALQSAYPGQFDTEMVDFLRYYSPSPWRYSPEIYPPLSKLKGAWKLSYEAANGPRRSEAANRLAYPYLRASAERLIAENPADLIVSIHPLANAVIPRAMRANPVPFVTVVTDMVSTHAFWYSLAADLIITPTTQARNRGIRLGIAPSKIRVIGQPVSPAFAALTEPKERLRAELGWKEDLPVVLLVGGGDGMGPVRRVAKAINAAQLPITLAVICGRNEELYRHVERLDWQIPHHIYGFTDQMPRFMKAADIFVTKAGPGSISEAFICGLPIVMYACLPGQEEGNVDYVLDGQAGLWAPEVGRVVDAVRLLAEDSAVRADMAAASAALARPDAAHDIAQVLASMLDQDSDQ
ncbi:MAG: glycosyltransferase [Propionibacteriaceae bacterium]|jgi:1,2-diacylglycerol 3-beta-galactosyltransferase|nr:glycosyltransferase [Propionibacteriaceae bacterium]